MSALTQIVLQNSPASSGSSKQTFSGACCTSPSGQEETFGARHFDALLKAHDLIMTPVLRSAKATACDG
jgi:hypothetical protein